MDSNLVSCACECILLTSSAECLQGVPSIAGATPADHAVVHAPAVSTKEDHRQSDEHWNRFKGDVGVTSERQSAYRLYRAHKYHTELN